MSCMVFMLAPLPAWWPLIAITVILQQISYYFGESPNGQLLLNYGFCKKEEPEPDKDVRHGLYLFISVILW